MPNTQRNKVGLLHDHVNAYVIDCARTARAVMNDAWWDNNPRQSSLRSVRATAIPIHEIA